MLSFPIGRTLRAAAASLGFGLTALVCVAGKSGATASPYAACMTKAVSTRDMQECQRQAVTAANARLQIALTTALRALPADQRAKLKIAQQRWTVFRQSDCEVFYGNDTGTIATIHGGQCMLDRTEDRIKQLHDFSRSEGT
jgi:uncharacterized protein YecT (DUF1311 family)